MTKTRFFVHGTPKGQPRPRAYSRGGKAGVYDPKTADEWKAMVGWEARRHEFDAGQAPVQVTLQFWMPRPKSHYGAKGLKATAPRLHTAKPDSDNLAKGVLDMLTQMGYWRDDAQVVVLHVAKAYGKVPGCDVLVEVLGFPGTVPGAAAGANQGQIDAPAAETL